MWLIDKLAIGVGFALSAFDRGGLDQVGNGLALAFGAAGGGLRRIQTGRVQNYGLVLFGGMAVIALVVLLGGTGAAMILDPNVGKVVLQLVLWLPLVGAIVVVIAGLGQQEPHRTRWLTRMRRLLTSSPLRTMVCSPPRRPTRRAPRH